MMKTDKILTVTLNPAFDRIVSGGRSRTFSGGKGVNVARALKALGLDGRPLVAAGEENGARFVEALFRDGLRPILFSVPGRVRTNTTIISGRGAVRRVMESGPLWRKQDVARLKKALRGALRGVGMVIFSGSLPPGAPPCLYRDLILIARRCGVPACLDTSAQALEEGLCARPFLVKPNRKEAQQILKSPLRSMAAVKKGLQSLGRHGMKRVLLTLGAQGLVLAEESLMIRATGCQVPGHTVGCGDAALAGWIAAYRQGADGYGQARLSAACGMDAASRIKPGAVRSRQVFRHIHKIKVEEF